MKMILFSVNKGKDTQNTFLGAVTLAVASVLIIVGGLAAFKSADKLYHDNPSPYIIIDAGHGGEDGGAVAADGTLEKDINLSIALKLNDILTSLGYQTVMTRTEDTSICDTDLSTIREIKVSDMKNRLKICNSDDNNILISIHQNKFEQSKYSGTQVFFSPNSDSNVLAEAIQQSVVSLLQPENTRAVKPADKNIYLLYNAAVPAVICECGFMSNPEELTKLKDEDYQNKMSFAIAQGLLSYQKGE